MPQILFVYYIYIVNIIGFDFRVEAACIHPEAKANTFIHRESLKYQWTLYVTFFIGSCATLYGNM